MFIESRRLKLAIGTTFCAVALLIGAAGPSAASTLQTPDVQIQSARAWLAQQAANQADVGQVALNSFDRAPRSQQAAFAALLHNPKAFAEATTV